MTAPLVSVIMTVYNCERYIERSLESIFNQSFQDFEFIICDDSSTDKTWRICIKHFSNNRNFVRIVHTGNRKPSGCGVGRNEAIKYAKGKYIAIQDADDISHPNRLEKEVEFLENNNDIFCVGSFADMIDADGHFMNIMDYPPVSPEDIEKDIRKYINPIIDPSSMFRRDIFNKLGGYDKEWKLIPDFNLWVRAILGGYKIANIDSVLVDYRRHDNSVTNKYHDDTVREHFAMCRKYLPSKSR